LLPHQKGLDLPHWHPWLLPSPRFSIVPTQCLTVAALRVDLTGEKQGNKELELCGWDSNNIRWGTLVMATLQSDNCLSKELRQSLDSDRDPKDSGHIMGQWYKEHCLLSPASPKIGWTRTCYTLLLTLATHSWWALVGWQRGLVQVHHHQKHLRVDCAPRLSTSSYCHCPQGAFTLLLHVCHAQNKMGVLWCLTTVTCHHIAQKIQWSVWRIQTKPHCICSHYNVYQTDLLNVGHTQPGRKKHCPLQCHNHIPSWRALELRFGA